MEGIRLGCALISNDLFVVPLQQKMPGKRQKNGSGPRSRSCIGRKFKCNRKGRLNITEVILCHAQVIGA